MAPKDRPGANNNSNGNGSTASKKHAVNSSGNSGSGRTRKERLKVKIDDVWYDLTNWQQIHPGGEEILQHVNNEDATDAFYAIHSKEAVQRLKRMHCQPSAPTDPETDELNKNFRAFRQRLEREGWFERSIFWDTMAVVHVYSLYAFGMWLAPTWPVLATFVVGVAMAQAGWAGHDLAHARGTYPWFTARLLSGPVNGFSNWWWADKHNTHHLFPNMMGVDRDIANDPILHIWFPSPDKDVWFRKYQYLYFAPVYSALFLSWRWQSFWWTIERKMWGELALLLVSYVPLAMLPWKVALGSVLIGGFIVAIVVTASHQSEELVPKHKEGEYGFVREQFISTRDAWSTNPLVNYIWGGMQYQLEHHLFPTMPRYHYRALVPLLKQFAQENNIEYRADGAWEILYRNFKTMYKYSQQPSIKSD
eukprot:TRINITY_DN86210_c0_g1_i1.p2 TRINITY_DN86210_c0_g1~~TRINITY_DN86210_c0_g1_i1.p2  ORF type:complete len:420 (-),score=238.22 TRINITY_DN86210_c0_g1_i1:168-1427(-)